MSENFDHTDLTLNGRYNEDGTRYELYVLINGTELPVQYLTVADHREAFEEAKKAPEDGDAKKAKSG